MNRRRLFLLKMTVSVLLASVMLVSFSACDKEVKDEIRAEKRSIISLEELFCPLSYIEDGCIAPHIFDFESDIDLYEKNIVDYFIPFDIYNWSERSSNKQNTTFGIYGADKENKTLNHKLVPEGMAFLYDDCDCFIGEDYYDNTDGDICYQLALTAPEECPPPPKNNSANVKSFCGDKTTLGTYEANEENEILNHKLVPESIKFLYNDFCCFIGEDYCNDAYGNICYQAALIENGVPTIEEISPPVCRRYFYDDFYDAFYSDDFVANKGGRLYLYSGGPDSEKYNGYYEFLIDNEGLSAKCFIASGIMFDYDAVFFETTCRIIATETVDGKTYRYVLTLNMYYDNCDKNIYDYDNLITRSYGYDFENDDEFLVISDEVLELLPSIIEGEYNYLTVSEDRCREYVASLLSGFVKTA